MDNKGIVKFSHSYIPQGTEISQRKVLGFFLKLTVHIDEYTFKSWGKVGKSLQLP